MTATVGTRLGTRSYRTTAVHPVRTLRFRLRRRPARVLLTIRPALPAGSATRIHLAANGTARAAFST